MPLFTSLPTPLALYDGELSVGGTGVGTANAVYYVACTLLVSATLTGVRIHYGAGSGHYDVGIYSDSSGSPGTLLANAASSATALTASAGNLNPAFINGNLSLSPGRYWLAWWIDNATDTLLRQSANSNSMEVCKIQTSVTGPCPASAGTVANTTFKPIMVGLLSGGWS